jgi:hypothetical protein
MAKVVKISEDDLVDIIKKILANKTIDLENLISLIPKTFSSAKTSSSNSQSGVNKPSEMKTSAKGQELLNNELFKQKIKEISSEIGISENSIVKLMKHESGLDSSVKNSLGCVGLIQFCPDSSGGSTKTINGKTYNLSELQNDLELQLDAIKEFWSKGKRDGKIKDAKDLYVYNFFPVAAGKSDDFVLKTKSLSAEKIARANPVFNRTLGRPIDTPLTVGDLSDYYVKKGMV